MESFPLQSGDYLPPTQDVALPSLPTSADSPAAQLVEEMARAWRNGQRLLADQLLAQHAGLRSQQDVVLRLICEEICLRREEALPIDRGDFERRFPEWQQQIQIFFECRQILEESSDTGQPPSLGQVGDFRLLSELGQGGQGRVYLATQPLLADRPVVLKITPCHGREHLSLARLQHTNIVPLYWAQDMVAEDQRLLCMPYFGSVTLAGLQKSLAAVPAAQRSGQQILEVLDQTQSAHVPPLPADGPARLLLARASFAQAVAWMGACLAEALHYAHERELVHLDLKPSNILLTIDGQPMLLDFHLARHPVQPGAPETQGLGGTPEFMSPEQEAAFRAFCQGQPAPQAVDGRSDVFSLGLVLYLLLGGSCPYRWKTARRLETCNPQVSLGLADIIHKCLARDPHQRYGGADQLAGDLRRHLNNLTLRGVPNRSWQERWHKWRRRKPHSLTFGLMLLALLALVGMAGGLLYAQHRARLHQQELTQKKIEEDCRRAEKALAQSQAQGKDKHYDPALDTLDQARAWIPSSPAGQKLAEAFRQQQRQLREKKAAQLLHAGADVLRAAAVADSLAVDQRQELDKKCALLWELRALLLPLARADHQTRQDVIDLVVIWSELRASLSSAADFPATQRAIAAVLAEVDQACGPNRLVTQARLRLARTADMAEAIRQQPPALEPFASVWEEVAWARSLIVAQTPSQQALLVAHHLGLAGSNPVWEVVGFSHLADNNVRLGIAQQHLRRALAREPSNYWANFYQGVCAYRLRQPQAAVLAFHICVVLAPHKAETYYNRGLAFTQAGAWQQALEDYTQALKLDPTFGRAALNRAQIHARLHNYAAAQADLYLAHQHGADAKLVQANLREIQKMLNQRR